MGERQVFQTLTKKDKITVVLYRSGIVLSAVFVSILAFVLARASLNSGLFADVLAYALYASVGMSVFFIHLYIGKFKTYLKNLYFLSLGCLAALLLIGKGSAATAFVQQPFTVLLLLPLSGCLGFVTAKEAFCFQLFEGYLLALIMPVYLLLIAGGVLFGRGALSGLVLIAVMLAVFTFRKVFMPVAYDIGDKTAYR